MLSDVALSVNLIGLGANMMGPQGLVAGEGAGVVAGVFDAAAAGSYLLDYAITKNQKSLNNALFGLGSVVLDIGTANIAAVGAKQARYGLQYYSKISGKYISATEGYLKSLYRPAQGVVYNQVIKAPSKNK